MMRKIILFAIVVSAVAAFYGCSGQSVGGVMGIPGFILDPIYYANTEVGGDKYELDIKDVYAVVFTDSAGTPVDSSLWVYFVPDSIGLAQIKTGDFKPVVALRVTDVAAVTTGTRYETDKNLYQTNFMVWMDINDGGSVFIGDTINLRFWSISIEEGKKVEGEFTSTLHRGNTTGLAEDFKFKVPISFVVGTPREF